MQHESRDGPKGEEPPLSASLHMRNDYFDFYLLASRLLQLYNLRERIICEGGLYKCAGMFALESELMCPSFRRDLFGILPFGGRSSPTQKARRPRRYPRREEDEEVRDEDIRDRVCDENAQ